MTVKAEDFENNKYIRLSDRILFALEMALDQKDVDISDNLVRALELAMTRNTGGGEFIERRDYPPEIDDALNRLQAIKDEKAAKQNG
ncbi:MAG TPA: hypothetical protein EYG18_01690 [Micavibrio sp.]|nr:hypothetical protein [Pseudomonadota bacterium]MEC8665734.1 hypothetical protein [Pseudomonadota bacterium]HIF25386.1 hypothetical protein [Micavibrio sp.]HIL27960.1 hypothetical protein [Micavibrio sp.]